MGLDADIICIGKFSKEIEDCLEYDCEFYKDTAPGTTVITHVFHCNTSDQSKWLAKALGGEAWDFNTHHINKDKVNWVALYEMMYTEWDKELEVRKFARLLDAGFICIYQPNG